MNLAALAIRHRITTLVAVLLLVVMGWQAYHNVGWLEDPEFSIKLALVVTQYPGASPEEVELQVTDPLERAIQDLDELDHVRSLSRAGESVIYAEIQQRYRADDLPQIWDRLRQKVGDAQAQLPSGAHPSRVIDDFGDVHSIVLAVHGAGVERARLEDYADELKRDLLGVDGVARGSLWGAQPEAVYVDLSESRIAMMGLAAGQVVPLLFDQTKVQDAGWAELGDRRLRVIPSGTFNTLDELRDFLIPGGESGELVRLGDIAEISRGPLTPLRPLMRFNGEPAVGIALAHEEGSNVVAMGRAVQQRLDELAPFTPAGIELGVVAWQPQIVDDAVSGFVRNVLIALVIVLGVLCLFTGLRSGLMVGVALLLTVATTLVFMRVFGIDLHRASVGAMIISLGMMVDNAIVTADLMQVKIRRGVERLQAAREAVRESGLPLLGATLVGIFGFLAIFLAEDDTGEYVASLFQVVGISLLVSWVAAMTIVPLLGFLLFKPGQQTTEPYQTRFYGAYRRLLHGVLRHRPLVVITVIATVALAVIGFRFVDQSFFPNADRNEVMLDYWLPEGGRIEQVAADLREIEDHFLAMPEVERVTSFIGEGAPRIVLAMEPELHNQSYGQLLIRLQDAGQVSEIVRRGDAYLAQHFPQAEPRMRPFSLASVEKFKVEGRFRGPDPAVLRALAAQAEAILRADPEAKYVRNDWRQPVKTLEPVIDQAAARRAGVTREAIGQAFLRAEHGLDMGMYREGDDRLPIRLRRPPDERERLSDLRHIQVWPADRPWSVPLDQLLETLRVDREDSLRWRRDRQPTLTVQADPVNIEAHELHGRVRDAIEAIELPPGYHFEWGGEHEAAQRSEAEVLSKVPVSLALMVLITVALFNGLRQPLIIFMTIPLGIVGVAAGLLVTGLPFGFMALLGLISLSGMLIKNGVVLLDQIEQYIASGMDRYQAVVEASVGRLSPISMTALTTALGMTPMLTDTLFRVMAVSMIGGLLFATLLTLFLVPALYTWLFRVRPPEPAE
ncbi:efflux RND transporter permease subunit [Alkalilimnicola ehrlichii MLHE-1]|uniref:Acriflavin resistance protein n=1 Tax=Alkalilimnicola ehrlichii (strain ATCC BAA-1101 / DSM 17681 / MLHE-1) TaxID=187272 RepID=Q0AAQ2_ALKEH|nr:efflux RND transporter permease subunit [Alkalilimnicola ehrlichii]ABI56085.1 acriflavin resistance protein [Alkalilimnicola ehrlichii MLHE-1]